MDELRDRQDGDAFQAPGFPVQEARPGVADVGRGPVGIPRVDEQFEGGIDEEVPPDFVEDRGPELPGVASEDRDLEDAVRERLEFERAFPGG